MRWVPIAGALAAGIFALVGQADAQDERPVVTTPPPAPPAIRIVTGGPRVPSANNAARPQKWEDLPDIDVPDVLLDRLNAGSTIERYVAEIVGMVRSVDREGDGLDRADIDLQQAKFRAQVRARAANELLSRDLDADLKVTRAEIEQTARGGPDRRPTEAKAFLERFDTDGDGVATLAEAMGAADSRDGSDQHVEALLALDPNGDGHLTADELAAQAEAAFNQLDGDRDGVLSPEESAAILAYKRLASVRLRVAACPLPPVPKGARLIVYGGYEGDTISSSVVGDQDQETNLIDLAIERGDEPLYLVLTSYESMIWRITGDTRRVAQVVANSWSASKRARAAGRAIDVPLASGGRTPSAVGVVGLPKSKVTIADTECWDHFYQPEGSQTLQAVALIHRNLGRRPDAVFGSYSAQTVSLPSGAVSRAERDVAPAPQGFDPKMWREAIRFWPGGLAQVDPKSVVAREPVAPYLVLPSQMGLSQLVGSGVLQDLGGGTFRVAKPIPHLPPRMAGAHLATLILAEGVPLPPGDAAHACVLRENSAEPVVEGAMCRQPPPAVPVRPRTPAPGT